MANGTERVKRGWIQQRPRWVGHMAGLAALAATLVVIPSASAQDAGVVSVPLATVVRTAPGVETLLGTADVPGNLVGSVCRVETRAENNTSVHPGNNLVVRSGAASVVLENVEGVSKQVTTAAESLSLGAQVSVTLVMGPDGVFSAGASAFVVLDCVPPTTTSTTSTTSTTTTTTTAVPTTAGPTTTVAPTTSIAGPTSSVAPPTTVPSEPPELAFTGPRETVLFIVAAFLLLDIGYLLMTTRTPKKGENR